MPSYTENALAGAIDAVSNGVSVRRAARDWAIPEATLRHRRAGRKPRIDAHTFEQKLSLVQETRLADWIRV